MECPIFYNEIWLQITENVAKNILPVYYVSNYGRIYSSISNKILKPSIDNGGYENVCLHLSIHRPNGGRTQIIKRVNRIVMITFCPIENYENLQVNHIDNNRRNNCIWNLEWCTPIENTRHSILYGYKNHVNYSGINNPMHKLNNDDIITIIELLKSQKYSYEQISKLFNISSSAIKSIADGNAWSCLTDNILSKEDIRISSSFTNQELNDICKFFECNDINNKEKYKSEKEIFKDCFYTLQLNKKYDLEQKRKTMSRLLKKNRNSLNKIANNYKYNYIE